MAKGKKPSAKKRSSVAGSARRPGRSVSAARPKPARFAKARAKPLVRRGTGVRPTVPAARKGLSIGDERKEEKFVLKKVFNKRQLADYKQILERLRDRVVDEISFLAGDNLNRSQRESSGDLSSYSFHMADQGTDNFDREFALNLVSSEQDVLYEIDDALRRIQLGNYGVCEVCSQAIEKPRLAALPFAKLCIACKSEAEKGKTRFRPFGPTLSQAPES